MTIEKIKLLPKDRFLLKIEDSEYFKSILLLTTDFPDSELILNSWYRLISDTILNDKNVWVNPEVKPDFYFKTNLEDLLKCPLGRSYGTWFFPSYILRFHIVGVKPREASDKIGYSYLLGESTIPAGPHRIGNSYRPYVTQKSFINGEIMEVRWQTTVTQFEMDFMDNKDLDVIKGYRYPEIFLDIYESLEEKEDKDIPFG
jgi:hypothetical protein